MKIASDSWIVVGLLGVFVRNMSTGIEGGMYTET